MGYLMFAVALIYMMLNILFPERMSSMRYFRIPREMRKDPTADVPIVSVALLAFSIFFFSVIHKNYPHWFAYNPRDAFAEYVAGVVFVALGLFLCIRPIRALRHFIRPLRNFSDASIERVPHLLLATRIVGVISIIGSASCLSRIFP